jgi:hypothetical protein
MFFATCFGPNRPSSGVQAVYVEGTCCTLLFAFFFFRCCCCVLHLVPVLLWYPHHNKTVPHAPAQEEQGTHTITKQYKVQNTTAALEKKEKANSKVQQVPSTYTAWTPEDGRLGPKHVAKNMCIIILFTF